MIDRSFYNWIINCVTFYYQKANNRKRDKNIWAFSSWEGNKYSDNSRYFFEYVNNNYKHIRCIWFTSRKDVFLDLKLNGYEVYLLGTKESKEMQSKAGVCFYTNGLDDFGIKPYIYGALIVSLWHGVSFKKIYGSDNSYKYSWLQLKLRILKNRLFSFVFRDVTMTTSHYMMEKCIEQFYLKHNNNNIYITGQPRNDILIKKIELDDVFKNKQIINSIGNCKLITYMPTWQSFNNQEELLKLLDFLDEDNDFNILLRNKNYKFAIKLHYLANLPKCNFKNLILLEDDVVMCTQKLLSVTDVLITDYSSVFSDFALINRPIIFFRPNDNTYLKVADLYDDYSKVCNINVATNTRDLQTMLEGILNGSYNYAKQNEVINSYFSDNTTILGCYCENVYKVIEKILRNKGWIS